VIDDDGRLIPGQVIDLPEDARVGADNDRRRR